MFEPSYTDALRRLAQFVPHAGRDYAALRNYDDVAHVSTLSPYIRHRILTEEQVLGAVLAHHSSQAAEKFIQEVFWRSYWKGWLEMRPTIWADYRRDLAQALNQVQTQAGLRQNWQAACLGQTGIACFDHWAQQLAQTGYLHNHARMWFASIWIYTLRLPWVLGADFFLRHLLDGDAASNTLSWRWVGGMQTMGKTYLARPDNIATYTRGQFTPTNLATSADPLACPPHPARGNLPRSAQIPTQGRIGLIVTEDDLSLGWLLSQVNPVATAFVQTTTARSPLQIAPIVQEFVSAAMQDCAGRFAPKLGQISYLDADQLDTWAQEHRLDHVISAYCPVGPTQDALRKIVRDCVVRPFDVMAWPHASHGFFRFKDQIGPMLTQLNQQH
jgi:deoxyribodipyrimidine photo-lyase